MDKIMLFMSLFRGRDDVYAIRWENKKTGRSGYSPACANHGTQSCRVGKQKLPCQGCEHKKYLSLTKVELVARHIQGPDTLGVYPLLTDNTSWFMAFDFDGAGALEESKQFMAVCQVQDVPAYMERSRGGKGFHVWLFFATPIAAFKSRAVGRALLREAGIIPSGSAGAGSFATPATRGFDRIFPNQDLLTGEGLGNLIALPLQGMAMMNDNTLFLDPDNGFEPFINQWAFLSTIRRVSEADLLGIPLMDGETIPLPAPSHSPGAASPPGGVNRLSQAFEGLRASIDEESAEALSRVASQCAFISYCRDNAKTLSEPAWFALCSNLAPFGNRGRKLFHDLSRAYPNYSMEETETKFHRAADEPKPVTCEHIRQSVWDCGMDCGVKSPAGLRAQAKPTLAQVTSQIRALDKTLDAEERAAALKPILRAMAGLSTLEREAAISVIQTHYGPRTFTKRFLYAAMSEFKGAAGDQAPVKSGLDTLREAQDFISARRTVFTAGENFFEYMPQGFWRRIEDLAVKRIILEQVQGRGKFSTHAINEIFEYVSLFSFRPQETPMNPDRNLINMKNGMLNPFTGELSPHSPDFFSTIQIPISFDPGAMCPRWKKFLAEVFPDNPDAALTLQEMAGYILTPDIKFQKAFMLLGEGSNGKGVVLNILQALVGEKNTCSVSLNDLLDPFRLAEIHNKLVSLCGDLDSREFPDTGIFKSVVAGDQVLAGFKYQPNFHFKPFCRLIFAANILPRVTDRSHGFFRRLMILNFKRTFLPHEQDRDLARKLLTELDGIFQWALGGLLRLHAQGHFTESADSEEITKQYQLDNDPVRVFLEEHCALIPEMRISKKELYEKYKQFCHDNGFHAQNNSNFFKDLWRLLPELTVVREGTDVRVRQIYGLSCDYINGD